MDKLKEELQKLANRKIAQDNEDFMVNDYAGGNIDDAYFLGCDAGETLLARRLLKILEE